MGNNDKTQGDNNIDMDQDTPLDLKGSQQHHKLKDQPGEQGDSNHTESDQDGSLDDAVKDVIAGADDETAVGSALKKAVKQ